MALLAGSQLASHVLHLTRGSRQLLSEIFPAVPHIRRFNLRSDHAQQLLAEAEEHLCAMAVPYILSIHEDLIISMLRMVARSGRVSNSRVSAVSMKGMHELLETATGIPLPATLVSQFHLIRLMRNCLIHDAGLTDGTLAAYVSTLDTPTVNEWESLTKTTLEASIALGERVIFRQGELVACLAVTKRLAEDCNRALSRTIDRSAWCDKVVSEYRDGGGKVRAQEALRKVKGIARFSYSALGLTEDELAEALLRA